MNIFYMDNDPAVTARLHCNQHVPKMVVETAQLLSNAHWRTGYDGPNNVEHENGPYRHCRNAGSTLGPMVWIMESLANDRWTTRLGLELCSEFERRFGGRLHKTKPVLEWLEDHEPGLPDAGPTTPRLAFDQGYIGRRDTDDPIRSYRAYYRNWKRRMKTWPPGQEPEWFNDFRPDNSVITAAPCPKHQ